jgi:hypothetical protein
VAVAIAQSPVAEALAAKEDTRFAATHKSGHRVVLELLRACGCHTSEAGPWHNTIMEEAGALAKGEYGQHVIQALVRCGGARERSHVIGVVLSDLAAFARHSRACFVVELCFAFAEKDGDLVEERCRLAQAALSALPSIMERKKGKLNYTACAIILHSPEVERTQMLELAPELVQQVCLVQARDRDPAQERAPKMRVSKPFRWPPGTPWPASAAVLSIVVAAAAITSLALVKRPHKCAESQQEEDQSSVCADKGATAAAAKIEAPCSGCTGGA